MASLKHILPGALPENPLEAIAFLQKALAAKDDVISTQNDVISTQNEVISMLQEQLKAMKQQIEWFNRQMFSSKSERFDPNQMLFDSLLIEAIDNNPPPDSPMPEVEVVVEKHTRKVSPIGRGEFPDHLEREEIIIDVPEEEKFLPDGTPRPFIGYDTSERLAYTPSRLYVKRSKRAKYGSPKGAEEYGVITAPLQESILPRCMADESLVAHITVSKFVDHLPLYRMEQIFTREGVKITRQNMSRWCKDVGLALNLLAQEIKSRLFATGMVHFDDSPVKLLEDHDKKPRGKRIRESRVWAARSPIRAGPWVVYDFTLSRSADGPIDFFKGYTGDITCDAYGGNTKLALSLYGLFGESILYGCWAHCRRYFFDAHKADAPVIGAEFLQLIKKLYRIEAEIADASDEQRLLIRSEQSVPILKAIKEKIDELKSQTPPSLKLGKALNYATNNWERLNRYVTNPKAGIDNNPAENAIRPIALGRKNWLFIGDRESGKAASNLLTVLMTCKNAGDNPYDYLLDVIKRIPSLKTSEIHTLIPEHWTPKNPDNS